MSGRIRRDSYDAYGLRMERTEHELFGRKSGLRETSAQRRQIQGNAESAQTLRRRLRRRLGIRKRRPEGLARMSGGSFGCGMKDPENSEPPSDRGDKTRVRRGFVKFSDVTFLIGILTHQGYECLSFPKRSPRGRTAHGNLEKLQRTDRRKRRFLTQLGRRNVRGELRRVQESGPTEDVRMTDGKRYVPHRSGRNRRKSGLQGLLRHVDGRWRMDPSHAFRERYRTRLRREPLDRGNNAESHVVRCRKQYERRFRYVREHAPFDGTVMPGIMI